MLEAGLRESQSISVEMHYISNLKSCISSANDISLALLAEISPEILFADRPLNWGKVLNEGSASAQACDVQGNNRGAGLLIDLRTVLITSVYHFLTPMSFPLGLKRCVLFSRLCGWVYVE